MMRLADRFVVLDHGRVLATGLPAAARLRLVELPFRSIVSTSYSDLLTRAFTRDGVARLIGLPPEKVRAIWVMGPGSYGRNDAGDAALDAAYLSKVTGRPVRVQGMRHDGIAWANVPDASETASTASLTVALLPMERVHCTLSHRPESS